MSTLEDQARLLLRDRLDALRRASGARVLVKEELSEVSELGEALARLDAGQYGRCELCGGAIGRQRLRALPAVRLCLSCSSHP